MTSNRVYRQHMDMGYVVNELKKGAGTQFDPAYTKILLELIEDGTINLEPKTQEEPQL
jgi:energy-coupling factor transport system substrate-specific component